MNIYKIDDVISFLKEFLNENYFINYLKNNLNFLINLYKGQ